ncbi:MAG: phytanoyl-CoA dioxygenase family protein [Dehalococcoidia bacterium]|nr:phytanoyl-CoA dioxygenase family protein [Dehalococcoidia bacterium]
MSSAFHDTFGYTFLPRFFSIEEITWMTEEFNGLLSKPGLRPCFADSSPRLAELIEHPKVVTLVASLFGPDWLYKGSDGNIFAASTPWHRDYFIRTPTVKLMVYLDPSSLDLIPGSHHVEGPFSQLLNRSLLWPETAGFDARLGEPPFTRLHALPGDVIAFSHNLIHRTEEPGRRRRAFGLHFAAEFNEEIKELTLIEMRTFGVTRCYGPHVKRGLMTAPFFDLRAEAGGFDGKYADQSAESIQFGRRLMESR